MLHCAGPRPALCLSSLLVAAQNHFFFPSRRRHTTFSRDWSSDVCSSDLWLMGFHGLAQAARDTLLRPELTLFILGLTLASTAFHELGHATACRFGGARPGTIGVGLRSEERRVGKGGRSRGGRCLD